MVTTANARALSALPVLVALVCLLSACGSDGDKASTPQKSSTAAAHVCAARTDLSDAVQKVVSDVKAGNLGDARKHASDARSSADTMVSAVKDLSTQERADLKPKADKLSDSLDAVGDARSLATLSTALTSVGTDLDALVTAAADDLHCSS